MSPDSNSKNSSLRQEEELRMKSLLLNAVPDLILLHDLEGNIVYANNAFCERHGYTWNELKELKAFDLVQPEYRGLWPTITKTIAELEEIKFQIVHLKKDGTLLPLDVCTRYWELGGQKYLYGIARDISEEKKPEEKPNPILDAFKMSVDSIVVAELDGKITEVNEATLKMYGADDPKTLVGYNCFDFFMPEDLERALGAMQEALEKGYVRNREYRIKTLNENVLHVDMSVALIKGEDGHPLGFIAVATDISERKQAEEELARHQEHLESLVKELEAFSHTISHDLRAPLWTISGLCQQLLTVHADKLDAKVEDYIKRIGSASRHLSELVDALLKFSNISQSKMRRVEVDLSGLVQEIIWEFKQNAPERPAEFVVAPEVKVLGDPLLLRSAIANLLSNAWKFSSKKPQTRIEFGIGDVGGRTVYFIRDNGAGFNQAHADQLFQPFQRLHNPEDFTGTGIGLATVKRIFSRHGGHVWAEGVEGLGATFYFTLSK